MSTLGQKIKPYIELTDRGRARRIHQLALNALQQYPLEVARLRLLDNGFNGIFRVDTPTGERWIVRVTLPEGGHNLDHVAAEMDWLAALGRETELSVPRPLASREGKLVVEASAEGVPEARLCEVFSWVPGTDLADHLTPANLALLGELSARLHQHARTYQPPPGLQLLAFDQVFPFPEPVVLFEERYAMFFTPEQYEIYRQANDRAQSAIDRLRTSGEPMRIIHGDLHQWNVRYARGLLSPIDFEDLMWGWPVQDIATTLYDLQEKENYAGLRAAFEQGYRRVSVWPERYLGEIDAFIAARGLGMANFVLQTNELIRFDLAEYIGWIGNRLRNNLRVD